MQANKLRSVYKAILKLHRSLPAELRELGDGYVKDEFRRHVKGATENQAKIFMTEWTDYFNTLAKQLNVKDRIAASTERVTNVSDLGKAIPLEKLDDFQAEQIYQLYDLKLAATAQSQSESKNDHPSTTKR